MKRSAVPDLSKAEMLERIGGTDVDAADEDERRDQGDEGAADFGAPQEQGGDQT